MPGPERAQTSTIELGPRSLRLVQAVALALVLFKFVYLMLAGVFQDEAYYWMWGQHPALSYYDHPPLDAWTLGLSSTIFGWTVFALRLPVALGFIADIAALFLLSKRLAGEAWQSHFWVSLLLFLATPIYWMVSAVALPDHLLFTFTLFALYFFVRFFGDREAGERGADRDLYLGALCLGLAGLSKYNAAFLAIAVILYVALFQRTLLRDGRLYFAGALTLLVQLPAIVWNLQQRFASWEFILRGRHAGLKAGFDGLVPFALGIVIFVSPFLFWPIGRFLFVREGAVPAVRLARIAFIVSSVSIFGVALFTAVLFHWNLIAYAVMLPFLALYFRPRWLLPLQALFGVVFAVAAFVNYAITPLTPVAAWRDEATAWSYGWSDIAAAVTVAKAASPVGFVAASDYTTASLLGFALKDKDVVSLSPHTDEYDYWFDPAAHAGQDAILVTDIWRGLYPEVKRKFESVKRLQVVPVLRNGIEVNRVSILLAKGFKPDG